MTLEQSTGSVVASLFFDDHVTPAMLIMPAMARRLARYSSLFSRSFSPWSDQPFQGWRGARDMNQHSRT
jgi:hypothetical protein